MAQYLVGLTIAHAHHIRKTALRYQASTVPNPHKFDLRFAENRTSVFLALSDFGVYAGWVVFSCGCPALTYSIRDVLVNGPFEEVAGVTAQRGIARVADKQWPRIFSGAEEVRYPAGDPCPFLEPEVSIDRIAVRWPDPLPTVPVRAVAWGFVYEFPESFRICRGDLRDGNWYIIDLGHVGSSSEPMCLTDWGRFYASSPLQNNTSPNKYQ